MPTFANSNTMAELENAYLMPKALTVPTAALAGSANTEQIVYFAPLGAASVTVSKISLVFSAPVTAAGTNFYVLSFNVYRAGVVVASAVTGSYSTATTSAAAFNEVPVVTTTFYLKPGDVLTLVGTKTGTGAALPAGLLVVHHFADAGQA